MEVAHEGVTAPIGFQAAGVNCGIKKLRKDVALVVSAVPAVTAAMFTTNSVVAAPVVVGMMFNPEARARRKSEWGISKTFWSLV